MDLSVPPALLPVLTDPDAALFVSISGGKDSQAMLTALCAAHAREEWAAGLYAIHADLGRMEWAETPAAVEAQCAALGIHLRVVRRPQGDLLDEMRQRMRTLAGKNPFPTATTRFCTADQKSAQLDKAKIHTVPWPDAKNRYCTADQKRGPIQTATRGVHWPSAAARYCTAHQKTAQIQTAERGYSLVVSAIGIRAQESKARATKADWELDKGLTGKRYRGRPLDECLAQWRAEQHLSPGKRARLAVTWRPILDWSEEDVWASLGTSLPDLIKRRRLYQLGLPGPALRGWPAHPAYVYGNDRVSCAFCVLGSQNDLAVGARHNPELLDDLIAMEEESGYAFQQGYALGALKARLAAQDREDEEASA